MSSRLLGAIEQPPASHRRACHVRRGLRISEAVMLAMDETSTRGVLRKSSVAKAARPAR
jgi:hypothetical protein